MFLPSPKPLIPILVKPVLPAWVLVAALAAQYAIIAQITEVVNGVTADYLFESVRQNADPENSHNASFKNLWKACTKGSESLYIGSAHGFVHLKSGEEIKVSNSSGKYHPENCRIKTK